MDISISLLLAGYKNYLCDAFNEISAVPLSALAKTLTLEVEQEILQKIVGHLKIMLPIQTFYKPEWIWK